MKVKEITNEHVKENIDTSGELAWETSLDDDFGIDMETYKDTLDMDDYSDDAMEDNGDYYIFDDGSEVVEFVGDCTYNDDPAEVYIQFVFYSDDGFSLEYACIKVNGEIIETEESDIFQLIYKPFSQYAEEVLEEPLDDEVEEKFFEWYLEILEKEEGYYE